MNLRFLYFSVCLQSVHLFSKFSCHGNTLLTVFSISEFSDPKHPLNTNSDFFKLLPKFGCRSNVICFLKNSGSIFEFANPVNPILRAKNVSLPCTKLKCMQFSHIFVYCGCHGNAVCFSENSDSTLSFADPQNPTIHS